MSTPSFLLIGFPGGTEMLVILVVVLIFFGHKIPGLARSLGSGITEFKAGLKEGEGGPKGEVTDGSDSSSKKGE